MKSGTTTLHELLGEHPEVSMSEPKEPCHFVPSEVLKAEWPEMWRMEFWKDEASYLSVFRDKPHARFFGESSTDYSKLPRIPGVAEAIHAYAPEARIIYIMRDPVERTISHYWHFVEHRGETRPLMRAIREEPHYTEVSHYAMQLAPYLRLYGPRRVYALTFEELTRDPVKSVQATYRWLEIAADFVPMDCGQAHNVTPERIAQKRKGAIWLDRVRHSTLWGRAGPMLPGWFRQLGRGLLEKRVDRRSSDTREVIRYLQLLQQPQTEHLAHLLGRPFLEWKTLHGS